ncbi:Ras family protein [Tritrichomonas foetus]|uniref:Ras family protein n=1 Tax=Tritrichomonas foetus TaxID=1144522 RepID=A0A1J4KAB5_9EUKA|nr:Ras family protein [Tritrichomonas foetus]|eukprot:OHT08367.1 Ras family protein [Tritrichomonas foetus]
MSDEVTQLKYVIIGASGGGKTSILRRLAEDRFVQGTQSTVGIEYFTYFTTVENHKLKMMLWDTAGQERFYTIAKAYFRAALGVILVYDITDRKTFEQIPRWLRDARLEADPKCVAILIGNKLDLADRRTVSREEAEEFAKTHELEYYETSAFNGEGIKEAFIRAATDVLHKVLKGEIAAVSASDSSKDIVTTKKEEGEKKDNCQC